MLVGCPPAIRELLKPLLTFTRIQRENVMGVLTPVEIESRMWSEREDGSIMFMSGYLPRVCGVLQQHEVSWTHIERLDNKEVLEYDLSWVTPGTVRMEQRAMLKAIVEWDCGLLVGATGVGKSVFCGFVAQLYPKANIIFSAPSIDTVATLHRYLSQTLKERVGQVGGGKRVSQRITVSTYDSVLNVSNIDHCNILVADEAHRASSESYARNFSAVARPIKRFGLTATPEGRSDRGEWMAEGLFGPVILDIGYQESVVSGSVLPMEVVVRENRHGPAADLINGMRNQVDKDRAALWLNRGRNELIAADVQAMYDHLGQPQTLVLVDKIEHLFALHRLLPDFEVAFGNFDAKAQKRIGERLEIVIDPEIIKGLRPRDEVRKRFETGVARKVLATSIFATGVSSNHCGLVGYASGAGAPIGFTQSLGRGSRTNAAAGKKFSVCLMWLDKFHGGYKNRGKKLINVAKSHGHRVHILAAGQGVETWTPPR